ncbi:cation diffusion facilitator family transporter [Paenibacillus sp. FSL H7-0716]|uniref:Cation diffusion facilitator family transporter n=1 Tax=Paenibacillus odorifer TaxID=189426 RepID=A0AB36JCY5_9BACL|nr:cation diffusion facilitator family transporter [Paenibacillus odorifer]OME16587.1 cation diffusion facilitator family transporter [Paenibacillus odorifer]
MANENEILEITEIDNVDSFDFNELETKLQNELDLQLSELELLKEDREKIGSPDNLGNTVMNVVWEQFINQLAATAGEDFIKENGGLTLDLRNDAHIQTTENFGNGKIATHNNKIDFQKRYDDWQDNFQKDDNGDIRLKDKYKTGDFQKVLKKEARKPFDKGRDMGSTAVNKDHTVSAAEIIRDPKANCHLEKQEQINFTNSEINLKDMEAAANQSKGDRKMKDWLDSERYGEKPADRFNINEEELRERDRVTREEYEKLTEEGERKSVAKGKQSQKEEAFRITGKALRAVIMQLFAELIKEVIRKLILWLKTTQKNLESLLNTIKSAINSFISKLKTQLVSAGSTLITTIATAILGPIVRTIKKVWTMLKQGWNSFKEAIAYLKSPDNKHKPVGRLILETGKIVIAGLSAAGALVLGEVIEKGLMLVPIFAFEIPILGSLASLIGLFMGGLVAGIVGAIALSLIDKAVAKQQLAEAVHKEVNKGNEVLNTQNTVTALNENKLEHTKNSVASSIKERHDIATNIIKESLTNINDENINSEVAVSGNEDAFENMLGNLNKLLK